MHQKRRLRRRSLGWMERSNLHLPPLWMLHWLQCLINLQLMEQVLNGRVIYVETSKPRQFFQDSPPIARGPPNPAGNSWKCNWDSDVISGMPLPLLTIRSMLGGFYCIRTLISMKIRNPSIYVLFVILQGKQNILQSEVFPICFEIHSCSWHASFL